jgi:hypothetical protein
MNISEIVIPNSSTLEQIPLLSPNYNNGSFINGYCWLGYLTEEDRNKYLSNDIDADADAYLKDQIKKLLRIKQIENILI